MIHLMVIAAFLLAGLAFGSFVNAIVWRIHEQAKPKAKRKLKRSKDLSISKGRSVCVHCGHQLAAKDLIPLLSWISLGGKCRYCQKRVSWQYPLVELFMGVLYVLSYIFWPMELVGLLEWLQLTIWLAALVILVALLVYDFRWMLLPNRLVVPLIGVAVFYTILTIVIQGGVSPLLGALSGVLLSAGVFWLMFQLSDGAWIGGGDVKMSVALGLFAGSAIQAVLLVFVASVLGSLAAIPAIVRGEGRKAKIPYGPFLIIATIIVVLFGAEITGWYERVFLGL